MKHHLPARPICIDGESPCGLLIRAVEANGYSSLPALTKAYWGKDSVGWSLAAFTNENRYAEIIEAFGIRIQDGNQPFYGRLGPTTESARLVCNMEVPEDLFREDVRYFCPHCLQQRAFWRKIWMLKPYSVCPEHRVYLMQDCPSCGKKLGIARGKLTECECGADLKKSRTKAVDISALRWWLDCHSQDKNKARTVDAILVALEKIDGGEVTPEAEHRRLSAVHSWIESREIESWLSKWIDIQADFRHPRIQLLPLLRGKYPEMSGMAEVILKKWKVRFCANSISDDEYVRRCEAELTLGISAAQFKRFEKLGLLEFPDGRPRHRGRVSLVAINNLLFDMQSENHSSKGEGRGLTTSLASMVAEIMSGRGETGGYDVSTGLRSLKLISKASHEPVDVIHDSGWVNVNQMSEMLDTYPEAIRFLCRKGWIPSASKKFKNNKLMALRNEVEDFNRLYVLGGTLASKLGVNKTNLSEKLMALGLKPVAGPKVDGALVYVFKRDDIEKQDLTGIEQMKGYPTKTGRKGKQAMNPDDQVEQDAITSVEAGKILGIESYEVLNLIRRGVLARLDRLNRHVFVSKKMVHDLYLKVTSNTFLPIETAAQRLGLSARAFESKWVTSGVLTVHDFGCWRRVGRTELEGLERLLETHLPAKEAGALLSMHRSHLPNMEARGEIDSNTIGDKRKIRFYKRAELDELAANS